MRPHPLVLPALLAALALGAAVAAPASAATAPVNLGTAAAFGVLGASTVTNTGPTLVSGDLGLSPGTAVTGFPPGQVTGTVHVANAVALQAQSDTTTAYNSAAGRPSDATVSADLAGQTLLPGVYSGSTLALNGALTLDGANDPDAVFIFQSGSSLITGSNSSVVLVRGASACNVFWQVGSSATFGVGTRFQGTVAALASVTAETAATVTGRLLARTGAVTMDTNTISRPDCSPTASPSQSASSSPAPAASPTASPAPAGSPTSPPASTSPPPSSSSPSSSPASPSASATPAPASSPLPDGTTLPSTAPSAEAPVPVPTGTPLSPAGLASAVPQSPGASPQGDDPAPPQGATPVDLTDGTAGIPIASSTQAAPFLPATGSQASTAAPLGLVALLLGAVLMLAGRRPPLTA